MGLAAVSKASWLSAILLGYIVVLPLVTAQTADGNSSNPATTANCLEQQAKAVRTVTSFTCSGNDLNYSAVVDLFTGVLNSCTDQASQNGLTLRPINMLVSLEMQPMAIYMQQKYQADTGFSINMIYKPYATLMDEIIFTLKQNLTNLYDAWFFDFSRVVDLEANQGLMDLTNFVAGDPSLNWPDYHQFFRARAALLNGKIVGIPLIGFGAQFLYYRQDWFNKLSLQVPNTWADLILLARKYNGTSWDGSGTPRYSVCFQQSQQPTVLLYILASIVQYKGLQQGLLFDPASMEPLVQNKGMELALAIFAELAPYAGDSYVQSGYQDDFTGGKCLMAFRYADGFKMSLNSPVKGKVAMALLPGSNQTLDRGSMSLQWCTPLTCKDEIHINNTVVYINRAPYAGIGGIAGAVNPLTSSAYQEAAYEFISYLAVPGGIASEMAAFNPTSPTGPVRSSEMDPVASLPRWTASGYSEQATGNFLATMQATLSHPNVAMDPRILSFSQYSAILATACNNITRTNMTAGQIMAQMYSQFQEVLKSSGSLDVVRNTYWSAIGYAPPTPPMPIPAPVPTYEPAYQSMGEYKYIIASVIPAVAVAIAAASVTAWWLRRKWMRGKGYSKISPPGPNEETTLLVTDMQNSTSLWEQLSADVMDVAVKLHNDIMRQCARKHTGCEVATEGDSFLFAFREANDSVLFAMEVQQVLLAADWPQELLATELGRPIWAKIPAAGYGQALPTARQIVSSLLGKGFSGVWGANPDTRGSMHSSMDALSSLEFPSRLGVPRMVDMRTSLDVRFACRASPNQAAAAGGGIGGVGVDGRHTPGAGPFNEYRARGHQASASSMPSSGELQTAASHPYPLEHTADAAAAAAAAAGTGRPSPAVDNCGTGDQMDRSSSSRGGNSMRTFSNRTRGFHSHPPNSRGATPPTLLQTMPSSGATTPLASGAVSPPAGSAFEQLPAATVLQHFERMFLLTDEPGVRQSLLMAGLRVRIGMTTGVTGSQDVVQPRPSTWMQYTGRLHYSGLVLEAAKAVSEAAHGGMVLMSESTFEQLSEDILRHSLTVVHVGEYRLTAKLPTINIYQAISSIMIPRLVLLGPVRCEQQLSAGFLEAPFGNAAICFLNAVGVEALMVWNPEVAQSAVALFQHTVQAALAQLGGYLVEASEGLCLAAFQHPAVAIRWALYSMKRCLEANWPEALLEHELGEEIGIGHDQATALSALLPHTSSSPAAALRGTSLTEGGTAVSASTPARLTHSFHYHHTGRDPSKVLFRGLRLKAGIDFGEIRTEVNASSGRMAYRGRVMNRSARIRTAAKSGQVWASAAAWAVAQPIINGHPYLATHIHCCGAIRKQPQQQHLAAEQQRHPAAHDAAPSISNLSSVTSHTPSTGWSSAADAPAAAHVYHLDSRFKPQVMVLTSAGGAPPTSPTAKLSPRFSLPSHLPIHTASAPASCTLKLTSSQPLPAAASATTTTTATTAATYSSMGSVPSQPRVPLQTAASISPSAATAVQSRSPVHAVDFTMPDLSLPTRLRVRTCPTSAAAHTGAGAGAIDACGAACGQLSPTSGNVVAVPLGLFKLKGIAEEMSIIQCRYDDDLALMARASHAPFQKDSHHGLSAADAAVLLDSGGASQVVNVGDASPRATPRALSYVNTLSISHRRRRVSAVHTGAMGDACMLVAAAAAAAAATGGGGYDRPETDITGPTSSNCSNLSNLPWQLSSLLAPGSFSSTAGGGPRFQRHLTVDTIATDISAPNSPGAAGSSSPGGALQRHGSMAGLCRTRSNGSTAALYLEKLDKPDIAEDGDEQSNECTR